MATIPSTDPERRGDLHLLRRPAASIDERVQHNVDEANALKSRLTNGSATLSEYEDAAEADTHEATARIGWRRFATAAKLKCAQEKERANSWKWVAITLGVMLAVLAWSNYSGPGRPMDPDEVEARTP